MCGLAGWIGRFPYGEAEAQAIASRLRHRGPDGVRIRVWPDAALIHARLAVIDLDTGDQPLPNEARTHWSIVNGEIYNHRALRNLLQGRGHRFESWSDCAVVPALHEEQGAAFLSRLRGMFALASYDEGSRTMIVARDRFGIKPLFYALAENGLAFASELRAIRWLPHVDTSVDPQALWDFVALLYVPAPATWYRGIRTLEPGHYIEATTSACDGVRVKIASYHEWAFHIDQGLTLEVAESEAARLIDTAVASQLESDVPLGALLSGGIDSSLVSAAAQTALQPAALRTFNVQFPDDGYDETWAAAAVAKHIRSDHRTLTLGAQSATFAEITEVLVHSGQPFADTSLFAVDALSRLMRRYVTVALSGDGGDEGFGGYDFFSQLGTFALLGTMPEALRQVIASVSPLFRSVSARLSRRGAQIADADWSDDATVIQFLFSWVREEEQRRLLPGIHADSVRRHFEPKWPRTTAERTSRLERLSALGTEVRTRLSLPNDYLFKVDMGSMRHALEVRVPFLDEDLFQFGLSLPHDLKVNAGRGKRVLREVARKRLPLSVVERKKWGFGIPIDTMVDIRFAGQVREALLGPGSRIGDWFDLGEVRTLVDQFSGVSSSTTALSRQGLYQRIIMLLAIQVITEDVARDRENAAVPARTSH